MRNFNFTHAPVQRTTVSGVSKEELPAGHWSNYPITAIRRINSNFGADQEMKGVQISIACDLPAASGMSTSSAIICGMWLTLSERNNLRAHPLFKKNITREEDLMEYLGCNENGQNFRGLIGDNGVGTFGGSEDHTAIMSCTSGNLHMYSYCPTANEGVFAFPPDWTFVIGVSGAVAEKTGDKMKDYNDASLLAKEAARCAIAHAKAEATVTPPHLANVVKHFKSDPDAIRAAISGHFAAGGTADFEEADLIRRFDQFYAESEEIIPEVAKAFAAADAAALGKLVDRSQLLTDTHLQNQVPETVFLAKAAREEGAIAASAFGAGFGGSVWALVSKADAAAFTAAWDAKYTAAFPAAAKQGMFFAMTPGPGAYRLE